MYIEIDGRDVVAGESLMNNDNQGGSGIEICRGVARITDCRVSMAAASLDSATCIDLDSVLSYRMLFLVQK